MEIISLILHYLDELGFTSRSDIVIDEQPMTYFYSEASPTVIIITITNCRSFSVHAGLEFIDEGLAGILLNKWERPDSNNLDNPEWYDTREAHHLNITDADCLQKLTDILGVTPCQTKTPQQ